MLLSRGNIDVGKPFNNKRLNPAAHKGLARAAADGPTFMKWKVKFRYSISDSLE